MRVILARFSKGSVVHFWLTKSNTVTRLPTGDTSELPSGVNKTLPCA